MKFYPRQHKYFKITLILFVMLGYMVSGCAKNEDYKKYQKVLVKAFLSGNCSDIKNLKIPNSTVDSLLGCELKEWVSSETGNFTISDKSNSDFVVGFSTPKNTDKEKLYPLVVYLHGGIGTKREDKGINAYEMLTFLNDSIDLFIASPSGNRYAPWWSEAGISRILLTVRKMSLNYPIDPNRIFLAGVSDGAAGCYAIANSNPAPFAGFIAISGYGGILQNFGIKFHPGNIMQRKIYNVNGGKDDHYPIEVVNSFINQLRQYGAYIESKVYPNEIHGFDYKRKETKTLLKILRTWKKPDYNAVFWDIVPDYPNSADNLIDFKVSDGEVELPNIRSFNRNDTINITSTGLKWADIAVYPPEKKRVPLIVNRKKVSYANESVSTYDYLRLLSHNCTTRTTYKGVIRVNF